MRASAVRRPRTWLARGRARTVPVRNSIRLTETEFRRTSPRLPGYAVGSTSMLIPGSPDDPLACLWTFLRAMILGSAAVALENVALRHQLAVLQRSVRRPQFHRWDRAFWVCLSRWWPNWRFSLVIIQPAPVLGWHRKGFQLYWRWKSRLRSLGRRPIDLEIRTLIRRMARENPSWGRRRIQAELRLLGYEVAQLTVAKYVRRASPRPSPSWRAFLEAHRREIVAIDFFVVPTSPTSCVSSCRGVISGWLLLCS